MVGLSLRKFVPLIEVRLASGKAPNAGPWAPLKYASLRMTGHFLGRSFKDVKL
jgi:hypothetical protein